MSPHYYQWKAQSQATDQLFIMMFVFGILLALGYFGINWLGLERPVERWIQAGYLIILLATIGLTMAGPMLIDMGILQ
jgi:hypothetical protein